MRSSISTDVWQVPDGPGAWRRNLRYVLHWAHRIETGALLGLPLVGLIVGHLVGAAPTTGETLLLSAAFAGLGPVFQTMHRLWNPAATESATVRRLTGWTLLLGALLPWGASSSLGVGALLVGIAWLTQYHAVRNRQWVTQVVAQQLTATHPDAADDLLCPLLVRAQDRGLAITSVESEAWRVLARQVGLVEIAERDDAALEPLIARFVSLYNGVFDHNLTAHHALAAGEVVAGITGHLALAAVGSDGASPAVFTSSPTSATLAEDLAARLRPHPADRSP